MYFARIELYSINIIDLVLCLFVVDIVRKPCFQFFMGQLLPRSIISMICRKSSSESFCSWAKNVTISLQEFEKQLFTIPDKNFFLYSVWVIRGIYKQVLPIFSLDRNPFFLQIFDNRRDCRVGRLRFGQLFQEIFDNASFLFPDDEHYFFFLMCQFFHVLLLRLFRKSTKVSQI